jgi:ankyrin repeat protein
MMLDDELDKALRRAVSTGHADGIRKLMGRPGANINHKDRDGLTLLHLAARQNDATTYDLCNLLISLGADANETDPAGRTPEDLARANGRADIADFLRQNAADTALHSAARKGNTALVNLLLTKNPEMIDKTDSDDRTPLHWAVISGNIQTVDLLLRRGAAVSPRDKKNGYTPLHLAAAYARTEIVSLLLYYDASPRAKTADGHGHTAMDIARAYGSPDIVAELQKAMGRQTGTAEPQREHEASAPTPSATLRAMLRPGEPEIGAQRD